MAKQMRSLDSEVEVEYDDNYTCISIDFKMPVAADFRKYLAGNKFKPEPNNSQLEVYSRDGLMVTIESEREVTITDLKKGLDEQILKELFPDLNRKERNDLIGIRKARFYSRDPIISKERFYCIDQMKLGSELTMKLYPVESVKVIKYGKLHKADVLTSSN